MHLTTGISKYFISKQHNASRNFNRKLTKLSKPILKHIQVFWDTTPYLLANSCHVSKEHATSNLGTEYDSDDGGSRHPRKVSDYHDTALDLIRLQSLASLLRKSNMFNHYRISSKILRKTASAISCPWKQILGSLVFKLYFLARSQSRKKPLLPSLCSSVRVSAFISAAPTGRIVVKFLYWGLFWKCVKNSNLVKIWQKYRDSQRTAWICFTDDGDIKYKKKRHILRYTLIAHLVPIHGMWLASKYIQLNTVISWSHC